MISQEQSATSNEQSPPHCPGCQNRMRVKQLSPAILAADLDDVVYGCERCGTEAKRVVKRSSI
jgi:hypothetical protein